MNIRGSAQSSVSVLVNNNVLSGCKKKREIYGQLTDHWLLNNLLRHVFNVKSSDMHTALQNPYRVKEPIMR